MSRYHIWKQIDHDADQLVQKQLITGERLQIAKEAQKEKTELSICDILIDAGFISKQDLVEFIASYLEIPMVNPMELNIDSQAVQCIPAYIAKQYQLIPFEKNEDRLMIVMADPGNQTALNELQASYPAKMEICIGLDEHISQAIKEHYTTKDLGEKCEVPIEIANYETTKRDAQDVEVSGEEIVNTVDNIIYQAVCEKASDIHLDPIAAGIKIRYRIDGTLHELQTLDLSLQLSVVARIKVMANLDISEKRLPQDGRARIQVGERVVDLRIATYPTMWGEKASIRLLNKDTHLTLEGLGLSEKNQESFEQIIAKPHGLFLVTGPTGSGKTTTLYSAFMKINRNDKNAIAIEDPIENEILGVNQAQVNPKAGITFATALRSMLRHDPDIILVGEIRDGETADITARAAMTGHLVFSTLHTNSAVGAVTRLQDLGLAPFLIASSVSGIMAQRLVRKICNHCKTSHEPTQEEIKITQDNVKNFYQGTGCDHCRQTGYSGRVGIYEVIPVDDDVRNMISSGTSEADITRHVRELGNTSIWQDGLSKVNSGITSLSEVMRVAQPDA